MASQNSTIHFKSQYLCFSKYSKKLKRKECDWIHSMRLAEPWYQHQTKTPLKKKITVQYYWWTRMQKSSIKYEQNEFNNKLKRPYTMIKLNLSQEWKDGWFNNYKSVSVIHHINKLKNKNRMIISVDAEKVSDKIKRKFITKKVNKLNIEGTHLNKIKTMLDKPIDNIIINGENVKAFPLRWGARQGCPLLPLSKLENPYTS